MLHSWPRLTSLILTLLLCSPVLSSDDDPAADPLPKGAVLRMGTTRMLHETWPTCLRFSADDRYLASADHSGTIRFWDVATGRLLREMPQGTGSQVAFSPDGKTMAIGGYYHQAVVLWDLENNETTGQLKTNARALCFSSDGKFLATAGEDHIVRLWDIDTGKVTREMKGHQSELYAIAFSPDDRLLASGGGSSHGSSDYEIRLWEVATGKQWAELVDDDVRTRRDWVYSLAFSPDGNTLGSCGPYSTRLWDVKRQKLTHRLEDCSRQIAFSPTADHFVTCGNFGTYETKTARQLLKFDGVVASSGSVAYSHDGKLIASGNREGHVQLWDANTGRELVRRFGHEGGVRCAAFSPDGTLIASICRQDSTIRIWGTASGKELLKLPVDFKGPDVWWNEEGCKVWFAPYGREVLTWTYDQQVAYWRIATQDKHNRPLELGKAYRSSDNRAVIAAYSSDGQRMATGSGHSTSKLLVHLFDLDSGQLLATIKPLDGESDYDNWVSSLAFSPNGKLLAIGALNGSHRDTTGKSVELWDLEKQKRIHHIRSATSPPGNVCFSPDGKLLATSSTVGAPVQLWRVSDGKEVAQFSAEIDYHGRDMAPLAFSPDGALLAAADNKMAIHVWELATQKKTHTFQGHQKAVTSLAFSPDGKTLLSSSEDTTLLLWNVRGADADYRDEPLTEEQLVGYWKALADPDGDVAMTAARKLISHPEQTVQWLEQHLTAGPVLDPQEIPHLVKQLASDDPPIHLKAAAALQRFGSAASPILFAALAKADDRLYRMRIEEILNRSGKFPTPPAQLQRLRAISVLEKIGSPSAVSFLKSIAEHAPPTAVSDEAQAALDRLEAYRRAPSVGRR